MRKSAHYELRLPERDDQYNIDDFDDNFTAIDIAMNDNANAAANNKSAIADEKASREKSDGEIRSAIADEKASREKSDGEIRSDLTAHKGDKNNPHSVTKAQVGLGSAENKSSETIRGELTKKNVTDALGYTPAKESDVPGIQAIFNAVWPVGSTYVQYPQQDDPNALFNGNGVASTWSVVNYDGAFFRAQGGNAATFVDKSAVLTKQAAQVPNIKGTVLAERSNNGGTVTNTGAFSDTYNLSSARTGDNAGTYHTPIAIVFDASVSDKTYVDNGEVRPSNYTIRIWKRTA